jgi:hypothetical protein
MLDLPLKRILSGVKKIGLEPLGVDGSVWVLVKTGCQMNAVV